MYRWTAVTDRAGLTWPETSDLAKRDDEMNKLWRDSAAMIGLPDDPLPGPHS